MKRKPKISKFLVGAVSIIIAAQVSGVNFSFAQEQTIPAETVNTDIFTDVQLGHPEYIALKYLKEKGVITGYSDGSFKPDNLISRVEALKIILAAEGKITQDYIKNNSLGGIDYAKSAEIVKFSDIYKSMWYFPYIKKGAEINIIGGYPDGTFKPEQTVNKAESFKMTMLADATPLPAVTENPFNDIPMNEWFAPYFLEAKNRQIVYITMAGNANPGREMTRSTFAELVYRYIKSKEGFKYGGGSFYSDWFEGRGTSSGEPYRAAELTAAHRTLPFNTIIKVTNLENGKSVTVRVNDRGPYITGRVVDLSKTAFEQIAYTGQGVIWVEYQIINPT